MHVLGDPMVNYKIYYIYIYIFAVELSIPTLNYSNIIKYARPDL